MRHGADQADQGGAVGQASGPCCSLQHQRVGGNEGVRTAAVLKLAQLRRATENSTVNLD